MLGHLCDTFCHFSEIGFHWQAHSFAIKEVLEEVLMLEAGKLAGFLATTDYDKAREFYEGKLGFKFISLDQYALVMQVGGHSIRISKAPNFTPRQGTVLGWEVPDIEVAVRWLRERGVATEKYPFVQDQELGIWTAPGGTKVAWFKDSDGNILSVSQH
jgi:catechol 2,3-dioxygenase-like lactoylglutathione lyase family enzyme